MKKVLSAVLAVLLLMIPGTVSAADGEPLDEFTRAMNADEALTTAWGTDEETFLPKYPDYIGGMGFTENGKLGVYISDDTPSNRQKVEAASKDPEIIEFIKVKYSYNELQNVSNEINDEYEHGKLSFSVNFADVSVEKNVVEVFVLTSEISKAQSYLSGKYGDKINVFDGYDTGEPVESETDAGSGIAGGNLLFYIDGGILAAAAIAAAVLLPKSKKTVRRVPAGKTRR